MAAGEYKYTVKVTTDVSKTLSSAISDLVDAQKVSSDRFREMNEFLNEEGFQDKLVEMLQTYLDEKGIENSSTNINLGDDFQDLLTIIKEIRTAIYVLMDVKTGSIKETLDAFRKAEEQFTEDKGIKDIIVNLWNDYLSQFNITREKAIDDLVEKFNLQTPTIGDVNTSTFFIKDDEGFPVLSERFLNRSIGKLDTFFKEFEPELADSILSEVINFMQDLRLYNKKSFEEMVGKHNPDLKALEDAMSNRVAAIKTIEQYKDDPKRGQFGIREKLEEAKRMFEASENIYKDKRIWTSLRESFKKGFSDKLRGQENTLLQNESVIKIIEELINNTFQKVEDDIINKRMEDKSILNRPSISARIFSQMKAKQNKELNKNFLTEQLGTEREKSGDLLKINEIKSAVADIIQQAHIQAIETENYFENLQKIMTENFEISGFKEMGNILSDYIVDRLKGEVDALRDEVKYILENEMQSRSGGNPELLLKMLDESISKFFVDQESFEDYYKEDIQMEKEGKELYEFQQEIFIMSDQLVKMENYFEDAMKERDALSDTIFNLNYTLRRIITEKGIETNSKLDRVIDMLSSLINTPTEKSRAATSTDLRPEIGGYLL